jgi:hypothetical protein
MAHTQNRLEFTQLRDLEDPGTHDTSTQLEEGVEQLLDVYSRLPDSMRLLFLRGVFCQLGLDRFEPLGQFGWVLQKHVEAAEGREGE